MENPTIALLKKNKSSVVLVNSLRDLNKLLDSNSRQQLVSLLALMLISAVADALSLAALNFIFSDSANTERTADIISRFEDFFGLGFIPADPTSVYLLICFISLIVIVSSGLLKLLSLKSAFNYTAVVGNKIARNLFLSLLMKPYSFHLENSHSELVNIIFSYSNKCIVAFNNSSYCPEFIYKCWPIGYPCFY